MNAVQVQQDPVKEFFAPIAQAQSVSVGALVNVVVGRMQRAKNGNPPTVDELIEFAALCRQAKLNPTTSEVAPLVQGGHVSLIISVDGWIRVARSQPEFAGYKLVPSEDTVKVGTHEVPKYITSQIFIRGLDFPLEWRTYYDEVVKTRSPVWQASPNHMMQVRALANGIKRSFGLVAYTPDEADTMIEQAAEVERESKATSGRQRFAKALSAKQQPAVLPQKQPEVFEQPTPVAEAVATPTQAEIEAQQAMAKSTYEELVSQQLASAEEKKTRARKKAEVEAPAEEQTASALDDLPF